LLKAQYKNTAEADHAQMHWNIPKQGEKTVRKPVTSAASSIHGSGSFGLGFVTERKQGPYILAAT
jgi:hypothetical protein